MDGRLQRLEQVLVLVPVVVVMMGDEMYLVDCQAFYVETTHRIFMKS
jgi:hypothetical protein